MEKQSRFGEFISATASLLSGTGAYLGAFRQKKESARYCTMCQLKKYPLARVSYMIRTGLRKEEGVAAPTSPAEILVCARHHPDNDVAGAELSAETQGYLRDNKLSAECVYHYRVPAHVFRLG